MHVGGRRHAAALSVSSLSLLRRLEVAIDHALAARGEAAGVHHLLVLLGLHLLALQAGAGKVTGVSSGLPAAPRAHINVLSSPKTLDCRRAVGAAAPPAGAPRARWWRRG